MTISISGVDSLGSFGKYGLGPQFITINSFFLFFVLKMSSNKIMQMKLFFNIFNNMTEFLIANFPQFTEDIMFYRDTVSMMQRTNPRSVVKIFHESISKYKTQILECDEAFFLSDTFANEQQDNVFVTLKLKNIWETLNKPEDKIAKANLWLYLHKLIGVSDSII